MSNGKMREQFMAWYESSSMPNEGDWFRLDTDGDYDMPHTQTAWESWQAALAQQASEPEAAQVDQRLLDFYNVKTANELIAIQEHHIKRLQEKLANLDGGKDVFRPTFPRG